MRIGVNIILATAIVTIGIFAPPNAHASGGHHGFGHGFHNGHGSHFGFGFGFGFAFSPYPYSYPYYAPVYVAPVQPPTTVVYRQRTKIISHEKSTYCREYTKKIVVDGKEVRGYGTACLQSDGSWRMVN